MQLAEKLGMTRAELLRRVSSEELTDWMAYFTLLNEEYEAKRNR